MATKRAHEHPNTVLIFADDLGYGDLRCHNAESKVPSLPLIARCPGMIESNTATDQIASLCDFMATCASLVGAEDSFNMLPVLRGEQQRDMPVRSHTLHQSNTLALSIRKRNWKYLSHQGSGGNDYEICWELQFYRQPEMAPGAPRQHYDLDEDPGETTNLYFKRPEIVEELRSKLRECRKSGRRRP